MLGRQNGPSLEDRGQLLDIKVNIFISKKGVFDAIAYQKWSYV